MRKVKFLLLLIAVLTNSCLTFYFEHPIPVDVKNTKRMPRALKGEWKTEEGLLTINNTQWISIITDSNGVVTRKVEYELSDSLILRKYKKNYFFNQLAENGYWNLYLGFETGTHFVIKRLGDDDTLTFKTTLGLLADSTTNEALYFQQPITKRQIIKFIDGGGFSDTLFLFDLKNRVME
jgi:hypothetical protein